MQRRVNRGLHVCLWSGSSSGCTDFSAVLFFLFAIKHRNQPGQPVRDGKVMRENRESGWAKGGNVQPRQRHELARDTAYQSMYIRRLLATLLLLFRGVLLVRLDGERMSRGRMERRKCSRTRIMSIKVNHVNFRPLLAFAVKRVVPFRGGGGGGGGLVCCSSAAVGDNIGGS